MKPKMVLITTVNEPRPAQNSLVSISTTQAHSVFYICVARCNGDLLLMALICTPCQ